MEETLKIEKYDDVTIENVNLKDREISITDGPNITSYVVSDGGKTLTVTVICPR